MHVTEYQEVHLMSQRVRLLGIEIDQVDMTGAVERLLEWIASPGDHCRYVVTPNADHAVMLREHSGLRSAYEAASLVLADGMSIVVAARLLGVSLSERVAGSDLVPRLLQAANERGPVKAFLLGAGPGVAD